MEGAQPICPPPATVKPVGPPSRENVKVSPGFGSVAESMRLKPAPACTEPSACGAINGGAFVFSTVTLNDFASNSPPGSCTRTLNGFVPMCWEPAVHFSKGAGLKELPLGPDSSEYCS